MTVISPTSSVIRRSLGDGWRVHAASGPAEIGQQPIEARVPGVVHLDLLRAGLIPDPYLDDNESRLAWIGLVDWTYETVLDVTAEELAAAERHELVFEGLDTIATVSLNDVVLAEVANQHRSYRLDATALLREGANRLVVAFRSPIRHANEQSLLLGTRPRPYPLPYDAIRKSACSFGWDWGIATYASGIWRPAHLESWSLARLSQVLVVAEADGADGVIRVSADLARTTRAPLRLRVTVGAQTQTVAIADTADTATVELRVTDVERWWPVGYGEQPLYDVDIVLETAEGDALDETERRVGFRTLRWDTAPDEAGAPFQLIVNDMPVFVKGVNWIPDDAFPSRVGRDRYRVRLEQAKGANINLIRVWGGGIYEADDFYELADELGLLTWQDFLFACAAYSEDEPLRSEVEAEARENVARIAHHASLSLLTGNNESIWGFEDWGWKARLESRSWGAHYYYELFPRVIDELAQHVPYAPGSPFSPGGGWNGTAQTGPHPNDETTGTTHLWEQWNRKDWTTYRQHTPRFVAEFGWQGPPTWTTLVDAIHDDPLTPESPGMIVHQKAMEGNGKLTDGLLPHYRMPEDMETWHWAMQLNQANAVSCALDWFRSHAPHTSGAVVWQLNDCWPVTSWAAIDGAGREKPLLFALKNAFAPRVATIQPRDEALVAVLTNDTDEEWSGAVLLRRLAFDGATLATHTEPARLAPRSTTTIGIPDAVAIAAAAGREVIVVEALGARGLWFFAEPRSSALGPAQLRASVVQTGDRAFDVTITADALVRDLTLLVDRIHPDATVDQGLITLLPGESTTFRVAGPDALTADQVLRPEVARSGNQLVVAP